MATPSTQLRCQSDRGTHLIMVHSVPYDKGAGELTIAGDAYNYSWQSGHQIWVGPAGLVRDYLAGEQVVFDG